MSVAPLTGKTCIVAMKEYTKRKKKKKKERNVPKSS